MTVVPVVRAGVALGPAAAAGNVNGETRNAARVAPAPPPSPPPPTPQLSSAPMLVAPELIVGLAVRFAPGVHADGEDSRHVPVTVWPAGSVSVSEPQSSSLV